VSVINVTVTGNLTGDPELKFTNSGTQVATFSVAANERRRVGDKWEDGPTSFVRCNAWRDLAEHIAESLSKGDRVVVTGTMREREWVTDSGEKRRTWELTAAEVGAALSYATVKIAKAVRRDDAPVPEDPWANQEAPF
jgi:single-strand DNA-binding protein